jgi:hypothetical protein
MEPKSLENFCNKSLIEIAADGLETSRSGSAWLSSRVD